MPELTFEDLPSLFEENIKIKPEVNQLIKEYLKNHHPRGWDIVEGVREYIKNNHFLIEAPINDSSFGGFIRSTNTEKFICYINTAQPRIYQNFSLLHELYHLISFQKIPELVHIVNAGLDRNINERKADYFASLLLIDEHSLLSFYKGEENKDNDELTKIFKAIFLFKAPYKAILIRLYELNLISTDSLKKLFDQKNNLEDEFNKLGLDPSSIEKSMVINFEDLTKLIGNNPLPDLAQQANSNVLKEVMAYFSSVKDKEGEC